MGYPHKLYRSILARTQQPKRVDKSGARKRERDGNRKSWSQDES